MACECTALDVRRGTVGGCKATIRIDSECEQQGDEYEGQKKGGKPRPKPEGPGELAEITGRGRLVPICIVTYTITNLANSTASVTEFTVGDETFVLPAPIAPGGMDSVTISKPKPADCKKEKIGKVKLSCAGGGGMTLNKLEVCVLS